MGRSTPGRGIPVTQLHGNRLGIGTYGELIAPNGIIHGKYGNQIVAPGPQWVAMTDDFTGDVIADQWNVLEGTDSTTTDAAILAGGIGGVLRMTTGDAGTGLAADMVQITQALQWQASNGALFFQARLKPSAITTCYIFAGFTDLAATLEAPIESAASANTITTNATDAVGWMFDTRMSTDNWWMVGVANDVDATAQNSGSAPTAAQYETLRVEVYPNAAGTTASALFFRNGVKVGTIMSLAITPGTDLTPTIAVGKTSVAASMTLDVDLTHAAMLRGLDGTAT